MKKPRCLTVLQGSVFVLLFAEVPFLFPAISCCFPELLSLFLEDSCVSPELLSLFPELLFLFPELPA